VLIHNIGTEGDVSAIDFIEKRDDKILEKRDDKILDVNEVINEYYILLVINTSKEELVFLNTNTGRQPDVGSLKG
jgi:hypothetical protein